MGHEWNSPFDGLFGISTRDLIGTRWLYDCFGWSKYLFHHKIIAQFNLNKLMVINQVYYKLMSIFSIANVPTILPSYPQNPWKYPWHQKVEYISCKLYQNARHIRFKSSLKFKAQDSKAIFSCFSFNTLFTRSLSVDAMTSFFDSSIHSLVVRPRFRCLCASSCSVCVWIIKTVSFFH